MAVSPESIKALVPSRTAVATSATSARVGLAVVAHRLEHPCGGDHRPPVADSGPNDLLLEVGNLLDRQVDAQVAPGDHHRIGGSRLSLRGW